MDSPHLSVPLVAGLSEMLWRGLTQEWLSNGSALLEQDWQVGVHQSTDDGEFEIELLN